MLDHVGSVCLIFLRLEGLELPKLSLDERAMTIQSEKHWHEKAMNTHWLKFRKGKEKEEGAPILVLEEATLNWRHKNLPGFKREVWLYRRCKLKVWNRIKKEKKIGFILVLILNQIYFLEKAYMYIYFGQTQPSIMKQFHLLILLRHFLPHVAAYLQHF